MATPAEQSAALADNRPIDQSARLSAIAVQSAAAVANTPVAQSAALSGVADETAPTLSSASATATGETTASLSVSTNEGNGTLYWVVTTSAIDPNATQVKAGTDEADVAAADSGSLVVSTIGTKNANATGLTNATAYYAHFMHEDAASNRSDVVSSAEFTTETSDVTAPILSLPEATATGETTADLSVTTDEGNGVIYWVVTTSTTAPTKAQVKAGQDHTGAAAVVIGSISVLSVGVKIDDAIDLTQATTYFAHFMHEDSSANQSDVVSSTSFTTDTADTTAPTLASPTATTTGTSTASLSVSTDEANGLLYWVVTTSVTAPTAAQVASGLDHTGAAAADDGVQGVSATGVQNIAGGATGLANGTEFFAHFMHEDAASNRSTVATSASFTTDSPDVTAPVLSSPTATATGSTTANLSVTSDEGNGTLYWVVTATVTSPSAAQVKAGQNSAGAAAVDAGSQAVSGSGVQSVSGGSSGLTAATEYWAHFMHEDAATNQSTVSTSASFTTDALVALARTFISAAANETDLSVYTWSVNYPAGRILIHVDARRTSGFLAFNSVVLDGESAVKIHGAAAGNITRAELWEVTMPSSGTGNLVVTPSATPLNRCAYGAWHLEGAEASAHAVAGNGTADRPHTLNIAVPDGGIIFAGFHGVGGDSGTWTGVDEDFDNGYPGSFSSGASRIYTTGATATIEMLRDNASGGPTNECPLVAISFAAINP